MSEVLKPGNVAVVTGGASGIGLASARRFAARGMTVVLVDIDEADLAAAAGSFDTPVSTRVCDVGDMAAVEALASDVLAGHGRVDLLMNNAAARVAGGDDESLAAWHRTLDVNFWGPVHGERAFLPAMLKAGRPAAIVNTGSKQGITNPPGNTIYNVSKSALKTYSEQLAHRLRNTEGAQVSVHLLIPGWTTTGKRAHNPGAWLPDQVAERLEQGIDAGDFYILCPDNEVTTEMDHRRILWGAGDIVENRPPLSRWHPDWKDRFR